MLIISTDEYKIHFRAESKADEVFIYLTQLEDEGYAEYVNEQFSINWEMLYKLINNKEHQTSIYLLELPDNAPIIPTLVSSGSLSDINFNIAIGWSPNGNLVKIQGGLATIGSTKYLLNENQWNLYRLVKNFARIDKSEKPQKNKEKWGEIRIAALIANAKLDNFLTKSIVLTLDKLDIKINSVEIQKTKVIEVTPTFPNAPENWVSTFDRYSSVQNHYDIPTPSGMIHVALQENVKTVLNEIKNMPLRRVVGARAEAFIRNPYSLLGQDANEVIDEEQFVTALSVGGIAFYKFTPKVTRDDKGIVGVFLEIEQIDGATSETFVFNDAHHLNEFIDTLQNAISKSFQCCVWDGWELEILGETQDHLENLRSVYQEWLKPRLGISFNDVFDLSHYSERINEIGNEKPYYSPFIAKKDEESGWFPENVTYGIFWTPEGSETPIGMTVDETSFKDLLRAFNSAKNENKETFTFPGFKGEIPIKDIEKTITVLEEIFVPPPSKPKSPLPPNPPGGLKKLSLILKPNIDQLDYQEKRSRLEEISPTKDFKESIPDCLKKEVELLPHQITGIRWLQYLWTKSPIYCRGAIMADDMGLGKTLQLLTFIAACLEDKKLDPVLIVAPVSLLENWSNEIHKFFNEDFGIVRQMYGDSIKQSKLSRTEIDSQLAQNGLTKFLKPDWLKDSRVVLTTYETLRDLEFSFASQKWSIMVCDEAQKIKNPNAMVTRAAKKMNVRFKIACTGTPVENTIADLWCLFDYIQPGFLGALNEFCKVYRRPIEAKSDEQKEKVKELKELIAPQIIRRTKKEVANLKPKVINKNYLPISQYQRSLYGFAMNDFNRNSNEENAVESIFKNHLGLLQFIRQVCADPRPYGQLTYQSESYNEYSLKSPKIKWLIEKLQNIKDKKDDKAIIFTEARDLQRLIQRHITEHFKISCDIINGDTNASSKAGSRQQKIDEFQSKKGFGVIILSPLAVGFGVNIQKANHVIHYTRTWNPAKENQATDRAYRIGQEKEVHVYYPIIYAGLPEKLAPHLQITESPFKTFDVKLDELLKWKEDLSEDMLNGSGDVGLGDFTDLETPIGTPVFEDKILTIDDVIAMSPDTFEVFCAYLWSRLGYERTYRTPQSGDGGVDVVALNDKKGALIQCKTSRTNNAHLGWDAIKDVVTGAAAYEIRHRGIEFDRVCVTNQFFNENTKRQAELNNVVLFDQARIHDVLKENKITFLDIHRLKYEILNDASNSSEFDLELA